MPVSQSAWSMLSCGAPTAVFRGWPLSLGNIQVRETMTSYFRFRNKFFILNSQAWIFDTPSMLMRQGDGHPNDRTVDRVLRAHTIGENKLFLWSTALSSRQKIRGAAGRGSRGKREELAHSKKNTQSEDHRTHLRHSQAG